MTFSNLNLRFLCLVGIFGIFWFSFQDHSTSELGMVDLRAALLVFVVPVLLLFLFEKQPLSLKRVRERLLELKKKDHLALSNELKELSPRFSMAAGPASLVRWSQKHSDSFVKFGGGILSSRFESEELSNLLKARMEAEDLDWQSACSSLAFLAKLAPYFGMLATVIGMIKLLQNMSDFTKISGSMALAMQGTLYGLLSFTLVYSPVQRLFQNLRDKIWRRNEMILRWYYQLSLKVDPILVQESLQASALDPTEAEKSRLVREKRIPLEPQDTVQ